MRHAEAHFTRVVEGGFVIFTGRCQVTKKLKTVMVPVAEYEAYHRGGLIQDTCPSLSRDDAEFLISGTSPEGWEQLFGKE